MSQQIDKPCFSLPWVEKYRPENLTDIISHKEILITLTNLISNNKIPHMIFYGPPGTGKTTTILACAKKIYGPNYRSMILELNGSDDRGINVVREQIKNFSATDSKISNILINNNNNDDDLNDFDNEIVNKEKSTNIKIVILDEADAMTYDAQFALRRVVESYTDSTRFCLICNYYTKIIPALQSRCQMFRFAPINHVDHYNKVKYIVEKENINIEDDSIDKIIELSDGDMRKSLNLLQSLFMITSKKNLKNTNIKIDNNLVYRTIGYPSDEDREIIINSLNNKTLSETYDTLKTISSDKNLSNQDIIKELTIYYVKKSINDKEKFKLKEKKRFLNFLDELGKIEQNIASNTHNNIHLLAISSVINNNKG